MSFKLPPNVVPVNFIVEHLKKMHIKKGDVLVCDHPAAMDALMKAKFPEGLFNFEIPLMYVPEGSIETVTREKLVELIERLDSQESPISTPADEL